MSDFLRDPGPADEISQESGLAIPGLSRARMPSMPGAKLTALTTALAVVLTGGVVTAAWRSFQPKTAAEELVPSTAFAVGALDLGMPGQADALAAFAQHFPSSPTHHGSGSAVDRLLRAVFRQSSDPHVDYDRDIKPWLGDHVVLAGWMDKAGKPQLEGLIESRDDAAAKKVLTKVIHPGDGAVRFTDGYAVLGDTDALVRESIDAAHRSSIADNADYVHDIDALPGDPAATGWMDGPAVLKAIKAALGPDEAGMLERIGPMDPLGVFGPMGLVGAAGAAASPGAGALGSATGTFSGRTAMGIRVTDRYVEIDMRSTADTAAHQAATAPMRTLPASTIGALEIGDPSSIVTGMTSLAKGFLGLPTELSLSPGSCSGFIVQPPPARPTTRRQALRLKNRLLRQAMRRAHDNAQCAAKFAPPPPTDPLAEVAKQTGLNLPGDATTVLGDSLLASYGGLSLAGLPKVALRTHPADLSAAQAVLDKVQARLGSSSPVPLAVDPSGDDLVLATSSDYAHEVEQTGTLGEQPQVQLALGQLPDAVGSAGYLDLSKILPLIGALPRDLRTLTAIGFWTALDRGVQTSQMRIVVG
jgi:Protein of unknown function (DUF3352)